MIAQMSGLFINSWCRSAPLLLAALGGCTGAQSNSTRNGGSSPLVEYRSEERFHGGGGGTSTLLWVGGTGTVWTQTDAGPRKACPPVGAAPLKTLREAVRWALASRLKSVYDTSAHPGPNANYSRAEILELSLDRHRRQLRIQGWADVPTEVSRVLQQINQIQQSCWSSKKATPATP